MTLELSFCFEISINFTFRSPEMGYRSVSLAGFVVAPNLSFSSHFSDWVWDLRVLGCWSCYTNFHTFLLGNLLHFVILINSLYFQLIYPQKVIQLSFQNIPQGYILVGLDYQPEVFLKWSWVLGGIHILITQKRL